MHWRRPASILSEMMDGGAQARKLLWEPVSLGLAAGSSDDIITKHKPHPQSRAALLCRANIRSLLPESFQFDDRQTAQSLDQPPTLSTPRPSRDSHETHPSKWLSLPSLAYVFLASIEPLNGCQLPPLCISGDETWNGRIEELTSPPDAPSGPHPRSRNRAR